MAPSGKWRDVSGATVATVGCAEVALMGSSGIGLSCASRATTRTGPSLPTSRAPKLMLRLSVAGPLRSSAVGSPLHAHAANANPAREPQQAILEPRRLDGQPVAVHGQQAQLKVRVLKEGEPH